MPSPPGPPPPPPPTTTERTAKFVAAPRPPRVTTESSKKGDFQIELLINNGYPYKDHWAYWVPSHANPQIGVKIHVTGDVRNGFQFEIKRSHDFRSSDDAPTKRVPLQWVNAEYFDEKAMFNNGQSMIDNRPVCRFEASVFSIKAPGKSLNSTVGQMAANEGAGKKIIHRDCQAWIVESAEKLVRDNIFDEEIAIYLRAVKQ